jgi:hypothetical protein
MGAGGDKEELFDFCGRAGLRAVCVNFWQAGL